jgi:hypothetical protein
VGQATLGGLRHRLPATSWAQFFAGTLPTDVGSGWQNQIVGALSPEIVPLWRAQHEALAGASKLVSLKDLTAFQLWAPRVARFSFLHASLAGVVDGASLTADGVDRPLP